MIRKREELEIWFSRFSNLVPVLQFLKLSTCSLLLQIIWALGNFRGNVGESFTKTAVMIMIGECEFMAIDRLEWV
jgi:hypothetical protein